MIWSLGQSERNRWVVFLCKERSCLCSPGRLLHRRLAPGGKAGTGIGLATEPTGLLLETGTWAGARESGAPSHGPSGPWDKAEELSARGRSVLVPLLGPLVGKSSQLHRGAEEATVMAAAKAKIKGPGPPFSWIYSVPRRHDLNLYAPPVFLCWNPNVQRWREQEVWGAQVTRAKPSGVGLGGPHSPTTVRTRWEVLWLLHGEPHLNSEVKGDTFSRT